MAKIAATIVTSAVTSLVVTLGTMLAVSAMTGGEISGKIPENFNPFSKNSQDSDTTTTSPTQTQDPYEFRPPEEEYPMGIAYECGKEGEFFCKFWWPNHHWNIKSLDWDFGDETKGTGLRLNHTYASGGTYTVTLKVVDNQNREGLYTEIVTL